MKFKDRNLRNLAEAVIGDAPHFSYRSSSYITRFFEECDMDYAHDGSTRWAWVSDVLTELLAEPSSGPHVLPERFVHVLRVLMHKSDAEDDDSDRTQALEYINKPLSREGFEAYYGDDTLLYFRHIGTKTISQAAGHKDKALEYGKDIWMRYVLPTQHVLYFGIQAKKGKLDAAGMSKGSNRNISDIHQQALMMLGHEIFDPETSRKALVDHAFIVAGGEITKQAKNWLGQKLDATKRSQIMFMDRDDILNLFTVTNQPLPSGALFTPPSLDDEIPF